MQRFIEGFRGYVIALAVCLGIAGLLLLGAPKGEREHIPAVDYSIDAVNARNAASYQVWVPSAVPEGWVPTSSRLVTQKGTVTWRLGFATAARSHAMLAQSNEKPLTAFADRMANTERAEGTQQIDGVTWERRYRPDKKQRTLVRILDDSVVMVTGQADWAELAQLAATLRPQPSPSVTPTS